MTDFAVADSLACRIARSWSRSGHPAYRGDGGSLNVLYSNPSCVAFKVAAARVEHSSLRNTLSRCVRTVLGLIESTGAAFFALRLGKDPKIVETGKRRQEQPTVSGDLFDA